MTLPFHLLDVFTTGASFSGNQLLVVEDRKDSLTSDAMLAIAKEINLAETAFIRSADVRIFTTDKEVPQAGHPVLGLAEIMASKDESAITLQTQKGAITVTRRDDGRLTMSQDRADWLGEVEAADLSRILSGNLSSLVSTSFPIGSTCGLPYVLAEVKSENDLMSLQINRTQAPSGDWSLYFYCHAEATEAAMQSLRARMFCFEDGEWIEDVATGSAAGPLAAHLAPISACITQGSKRRAHLYVSATSRDSRVDVGGDVVRVASGQWSALP